MLRLFASAVTAVCVCNAGVALASIAAPIASNDRDEYGFSRKALERIVSKEGSGEDLSYYERAYIKHHRRNEEAIRRRLARSTTTTLEMEVDSGGVSLSFVNSQELEARLDDDVLATPRRLPSVSGVPAEPCTREGQCSGQGTCNPQDLCVCDWMWEGNNCDEPIKDQKFVFDGDADFSGLESWQFILMFGIPLITIPTVFCCMAGHFWKKGYFEEL